MWKNHWKIPAVDFRFRQNTPTRWMNTTALDGHCNRFEQGSFYFCLQLGGRKDDVLVSLFLEKHHFQTEHRSRAFLSNNILGYCPRETFVLPIFWTIHWKHGITDYFAFQTAQAQHGRLSASSQWCDVQVTMTKALVEWWVFCWTGSCLWQWLTCSPKIKLCEGWSRFQRVKELHVQTHGSDWGDWKVSWRPPKSQNCTKFLHWHKSDHQNSKFSLSSAA